MLRGGIPIGRIFGIEIRLNYSWFIVFGLVTWSLSVGYFPSVDPTLSITTRVLAGLLTSVLFFCSLLAHELMHSVLAQRFGISVRSITLFIFGGVSQITKEPEKPKDELRIALAGPLTSLVVGGIFWGVWFLTQDTSSLVKAIAFWLGWINVSLAGFNLIPGFPLDGGRVLRSILWWRRGNLLQATKTASNIGRGVGYLLIFAGLVQVFFPGYTLQGILMAFVGWFLENAAVGSYRQLALVEVLSGHTVSEIMTRECPTVEPNTTIQQLVNDYVLTTGRRCFPVTTDSRVLGLITLSDIRAIPRDQWSARTVGEKMTPFAKMAMVRPQQDLASVMQILTEKDINQVPVVEDGNIVGMVGRDNLLAFVSLRAELGM